MRSRAGAERKRPRRGPARGATLRGSAGAVLLAVLVAAGVATEPAGADSVPGAAGEWRTLETTHFRIHFRETTAPSARAVARRVEPLFREVSDLVGSEPRTPIDVVISESGDERQVRSIPFFERPRILLRVRPPRADSLSGSRDWMAAELGRELVHLAHLTRAPEQRALRWATRFLPFSPFLLRQTPWLPSAYAGVVGNRLACSGRPGGILRQITVRRLAETGELPDLTTLAWEADHGTLEGMVRPVGAAFLEWLEAHHGPGTLDGLWRRMLGPPPRTFHSAVLHELGAPLEELYDRFRADWQLRVRAAQPEPLDASPGLFSLEEAVGAPDVSPDGESLVVEIRPAGRRPRLEIRSARDGAVLFRQGLDARAGPSGPRFLPDGSVLYADLFPDGGSLRSDLVRWRPDEGPPIRLTRNAGVRSADPEPDGRGAVAIRDEGGLTSVVRVDLETGEIRPIADAPPDEILDAPRVAAVGDRLAWLHHRGGRWQLVIRERDASRRHLSAPDAPILAWPTWAPDGRSVLLTVGSPDAGGQLRVERWSLDGGGRRRLSPPTHVALGSATAGDGVVYLEHRREARILREAAEVGPLAPAAAIDAGLPPTGACLALDPEPPADRPYGFGPRIHSSILGGVAAPSAIDYVGGFRVADVIGKWEALAIAGASEEGAESGGILSVAWRGWSLPLALSAYRVERRPSRQPEPVPDLGRRLDVLQRSVALETSWSAAAAGRRIDVRSAAVFDEIEPLASDETLVRLGWIGRADAGWTLDLPAGSSLHPRVGIESAIGETEDRGWSRLGGAAGLAVTTPLGSSRSFWQADLSVRWLQADGSRDDLDRLALGGVPSTLVPARLDLSRVHEAALPAGTLIGDRLVAWRFSAGREDLPPRLFLARFEMRDDLRGASSDLDLAGVEIRLDREPLPLLRLPASSIRVGAAWILDEPLEDQVTTWALISWSI